jgi:hypothetical protein
VAIFEKRNQAYRDYQFHSHCFIDLLSSLPTCAQTWLSRHVLRAINSACIAACERRD